MRRPAVRQPQPPSSELSAPGVVPESGAPLPAVPALPAPPGEPAPEPAAPPAEEPPAPALPLAPAVPPESGVPASGFTHTPDMHVPVTEHVCPSFFALTKHCPVPGPLTPPSSNVPPQVSGSLHAVVDLLPQVVPGGQGVTLSQVPAPSQTPMQPAPQVDPADRGLTLGPAQTRSQVGQGVLQTQVSVMQSFVHFVVCPPSEQPSPFFGHRAWAGATIESTVSPISSRNRKLNNHPMLTGYVDAEERAIKPRSTDYFGRRRTVL